MRKINIKMALCLITFSIFISIAFASVLFIFEKNSIAKFSDIQGVLYFLSPEDIINSSLGNNLEIKNNEIITTSQYNIELFKSNFEMILPLAMYFCLFISLCTFVLIVLIKKLQDKENKKIANELMLIKEGEFISTDNLVLYNIYCSLEDKFKDHLNDYKKLNSYLSHEQKNDIALLRTMVEVNEDYEYTSIVNRIGYGIDDILTLSENKDISLATIVDVSYICAKAVDEYKKIYPKISFDFSEEDAEILAKERWIYRCVANLLDNAIKYGNDNDIEVNVSVKNNSVIISVKDYGIGITKKQKNKIFSNRYRINDLNSNGYGIGLSLVSHVCDLCGGYVFVESELNVGSTFILSFPQIID